ncbi:MAG: hypothetical protein K2X03_06690 [Bryobacteraceae bacterium]|nr:hypothetical protein [Bryobacteraceae bacterium]
MRLKNLTQVTAMGLSLTLAAAPAAPLSTGRVIGTAVSAGNFQLNERTMPGSGSVPDGAVLATQGAGSMLHLDGGVRLELAPHSRGQVYQNRLVLEAGEAATEGAYRIDSGELRVQAASGARSAVGYAADGRLQVSANSGAVRVSHRSGLLLAQVMPGHSVLFAPRAGGATNAMSLVGTVEKRENGLFLTDETAGITVKLQGGELDKFVGKKVRIAGKTDDQAPRLDGIAATVVVDRVQPAGSAAKKKTGVAAGAAGGVAAGAAGLSTTAIVVGGIAVAGAVTGTSVAVNRSGRSAPAPPPSGGFGPTTISQ